MTQKNNEKELSNILDNFLDKEITTGNLSNSENSQPDVNLIKNDKSIQERINKKIITEDGRQLLI